MISTRRLKKGSYKYRKFRRIIRRSNNSVWAQTF